MDLELFIEDKTILIFVFDKIYEVNGFEKVIILELTWQAIIEFFTVNPVPEYAHYILLDVNTKLNSFEGKVI